MPTKAVSKAAVTAAAAAANTDIDNVSPTGPSDGKITFNPTRYTFQYDALGSLATATAWRDSIQAALTLAGRTFTTRSLLGRRANQESGVDAVHEILIRTQLADYLITNF